MINTNDKVFADAVSAAKMAVLACGEYLLKRYSLKNHKIVINDSHEKIADDKIAEDLILKILKKHVASFSYISEETQNIGTEDVQFIIDPIEGMSNYVRGIPFFATQIAIIYKKVLAAGFIYEPIKDVLYHAILNKGAYANNNRIFIDDKSELKKSVIFGGAGSDSKQKQLLLENITKILPYARSLRLYGSTGLELAYLAQGKLKLHINVGSKVYDYAPGVLILREAGGIATNIKGKNWMINDTSLIACSKELHSKILELLSD